MPSTQKQTPGTDAVVNTSDNRAGNERPVVDRPPTERPPCEFPGRPLQARQPVLNEFRITDATELVLGFQRHRMNQQTALPSRDRPSSARQVVHYYVSLVLIRCHICSYEL